MNASDIMTVGAETIRPDTTIAYAARLMLNHGISGLPVVDAEERVVGIVTEGDLLHRKEMGTERRRTGWLEQWLNPGELAHQYAQEYGRKVEEVMTRDVVTADPATPIAKIVELMEHHNIKRLPVVGDGKVIGMVSRSNLLRALSQRLGDLRHEPMDDLAIRKRISDEIGGQSWASSAMADIRVKAGLVEIEGTVASEHIRQALRALAENTPGVVRVFDRLKVEPPAPE